MSEPIVSSNWGRNLLQSVVLRPLAPIHLTIRHLVCALTLLVSSPSFAEKVTFGGNLIVSGCTEGCVEGAGEKQADNCAKLCACSYEYDTDDPHEYEGGEAIAKAAGATSYREMVCRAKVWPKLFDPPPPLAGRQPKREAFQKARRGQAPASSESRPPSASGDLNRPLYKETIGPVERIVGSEFETLIRAGLTEYENNGTSHQITCRYGPNPTTGEGYTTMFFWYRNLPPNFDEWLALDKKKPGLLVIGGVATLEKCPAFEADAVKARKAGIEKYRQGLR